MLKTLTKQYIEYFDSQDLDKIGLLLKDDFALEDPVVKRVEGKVKALETIKGIFDSCKDLNFSAKNIYQDNQTTIIEFVLKLDDTTLYGIDIIDWEEDKMKELRAYLDTPKG